MLFKKRHGRLLENPSVLDKVVGIWSCVIDLDMRSRGKGRHCISEIMQVCDLMLLEVGMCCAQMMVLVVAAIEMGNADDAGECMQAVEHADTFLVYITECVCER